MISVHDLMEIGDPVIGEIHGTRRSFKSAKIDSRAVKKGDLFFAIKGEHTDGHNFVKDAFKKGASAAVVEKKWLKKNLSFFQGKLLIGVSNTVEALGKLALLHRRRFDIPVICIGGSNGKTTTKDLTAAALSEKFKVLKTEGNLNNHLGLPMTLLNLDKSHEMCVLEVGCNHFGEVAYLCRIAEPNAGLVTNIGKEHLEFFKDLNGVAKAEFELYDYLKKKKDTISFFNLDDKHINKYSKKSHNEKKVSYSYGFDSDVKGRFLGYSKDFQPRISIKSRDREFEVQVSTFGKHSIYNGLAAGVVGDHFGVSQAGIKRALKMFRPSSSKRMEITRANGILIINDAYNSNPDSVRMGLETLMEADVKGDRHAVLADMLELGKASKAEHGGIGKLACKLGVRNLYTYGKESFETFSNANGVRNNFYFDCKDDLIALLRNRLKRGDAVYVKGSRGMKMEDVVNSLTAEHAL
jgi:UDP-N-acetylmuramoyl-tripeptide--D-alanyl-D-alanine ligase